MDSTRLLLAIDSLINLMLGLLLVFFSETLANFLGIPIPQSKFYPSVLGGVLFGIGIALALELLSTQQLVSGLGLAGAIAINLSGGIVLVVWLVLGVLELPTRGYAFLWSIAVLLLGISAVELFVRARMSGSQTT